MIILLLIIIIGQVLPTYSVLLCRRCYLSRAEVSPTQSQITCFSNIIAGSSQPITWLQPITFAIIGVTSRSAIPRCEGRA